MKLEGKKINFLGDSITYGMSAGSTDKKYTSLVAKKTGAICRTYGVSGTRIAKQKTPSEKPSHDLSFCMRALEMDKDADIVVVFGGTNDFGHGDANMGSMDDRTDDTFYGALHTLYTYLIKEFPNSTIIVLTPLHRLMEDNPCGTNGGSIEYGTLKDYSDAIKEVANFYNLHILDLFEKCEMNPNIEGHIEKYMPDGLHPNDLGHEIIADMIINFIEKL
ncbi:MAG: SGNH/GDSL hydrolase family protein [Clostridia bacterium]|nr:SGNH/GDSL hydrolase family protein [Clostridia bacterium]